MISSTGNSIEMYLATNSSIKYSNKKESQFHRNSSLVKYILGEVYKNSHHDTEIDIDSMTIEHLKSDDGSDETSQLSNLTLVTRELNEKLKKITPYIHSDSLNVTNTVISVHNYTTDSLYLNSIEKMYYKDINEFSKKPYFSINQEYPEDE